MEWQRSWQGREKKGSKRVGEQVQTNYRFLQETKLKSIDYRVINALGGFVLTKGIGVDSVGSSGGLLSLWNEDQFVVSACISNSRCILLIGELVALKKVVGFCNMYAACVEFEREEFYVEIQRFLSESHGGRHSSAGPVLYLDEFKRGSGLVKYRQIPYFPKSFTEFSEFETVGATKKLI
ncbi:hypothetical protein Ddye_024304 [Dipteronia dyeriana]|uniref:Uncharacterized protein n=1 Tax=Dipteronia dyeriana TaxID=168575 RepID=A0AAD9WTG4_9ROSI|nr:hypothetical protein Ddye_024304 [Dipteronia dyeriana]